MSWRIRPASAGLVRLAVMRPLQLKRILLFQSALSLQTGAFWVAEAKADCTSEAHA
ncbi:hypothetical protein ACFQ0M_11490 [Kitasatospora aburaviensis]